MSSVCPFASLSVCNAVHCHSQGWCTGLKVVPACSQQVSSYLSLQTLLLNDVSFCHKTHRKTSRRKLEREFLRQTIRRALICNMWRTFIDWDRTLVTLGWIKFGCVHEVYPEESDCVPAVRRPKLVTETGLIVCQYDRLSQQQLSFLFYS